MRRTRANPRQPPARHWMPVWTAKAAHPVRQAQTEATKDTRTCIGVPALSEAIARTAKGKSPATKKKRAFERMGIHEVTPKSNRKAARSRKTRDIAQRSIRVKRGRHCWQNPRARCKGRRASHEPCCCRQTYSRSPLRGEEREARQFQAISSPPHQNDCFTKYLTRPTRNKTAPLSIGPTGLRGRVGVLPNNGQAAVARH
ncbi:hypothetical protein BC826DRAFT_1019963, partial [Russula brevipes]